MKVVRFRVKSVSALVESFREGVSSVWECQVENKDSENDSVNMHIRWTVRCVSIVGMS